MLATATTTSTSLYDLADADDLAVLEKNAIGGNIAAPQPSYLQVTIRNEQNGQTIYIELYQDAVSTDSLAIAYQAERTVTVNSIKDLNIIASASSSFKYLVQQA